MSNKSSDKSPNFSLHALTHLEQAEGLVLATLDPGADGLGVKTLSEVLASGELTHTHARSVLIKDNSITHKLFRRPLEVIAGPATVGQVQRRLALIITRRQHLDEVRLTAARVPARALAVLGGAGDLAVERPDGGHVAVELAAAVHGHLEAEEEDLVGAAEALVGYVLGAGEAAALVARLAGPDGELLVGADEAGLEDLGLGGAAGAGAVQEREGVAPGAVSKVSSLECLDIYLKTLSTYVSKTPEPSPP